MCLHVAHTVCCFSFQVMVQPPEFADSSAAPKHSFYPTSDMELVEFCLSGGPDVGPLWCILNPYQMFIYCQTLFHVYHNLLLVVCV